MNEETKLVVTTFSERPISGRATIKNGQVLLELLSTAKLNENQIFQEAFVLDDGSLLHIVPTMTDSGYSFTHDRTVYKISARSHNATISSQKLNITDHSIRTLSFSIHGATDCLESNEYEKGVLRDHMKRWNTIIDVDLGSMKISIFRAVSFGPSRVPSFGDYRASIAMDHAEPKDEIRKILIKLQSFLSYVSGRLVFFSEFDASPKATDDPSGDFFSYKWLNGFHIPDKDYGYGDALLFLRLPEHHEEFRAALRIWMSAGDEWLKYFNGLLTCFRHDNIIGGQRLLDASRWTEDHPTNRPLRFENQQELDEILSAMKRLDLSSSTNSRVIGAIKAIKTESWRAFYSRSMDECPPVITHNGSIIDALVQSASHRGEHAHSNVIDVDFDGIERAIAALETFAMWLLPWQPAQHLLTHRAELHPLFGYANHCRISSS